MLHYEKSCGAIIFRRSTSVPDVLIIQHRGGHWGFPKGHVEAGETEEQTARREVYEETGLHIELLSDFREEETYSPAPGISKTVVYFLAAARSDHVRSGLPEVIDYAWLPVERAAARLSFTSQQRLLHLAYQHLILTLY